MLRRFRKRLQFFDESAKKWGATLWDDATACHNRFSRTPCARNGRQLSAQKKDLTRHRFRGNENRCLRVGHTHTEAGKKAFRPYFPDALEHMHVHKWRPSRWKSPSPQPFPLENSHSHPCRQGDFLGLGDMPGGGGATVLASLVTVPISNYLSQELYCLQRGGAQIHQYYPNAIHVSDDLDAVCSNCVRKFDRWAPRARSTGTA